MNLECSEANLHATIGHNLYQVRARQGLSQRAAAAGLGISLSQLKNYEQGKDAIRLDTAVSACMFYGTTLQRLFCGSAYGDAALGCPWQRVQDKHAKRLIELPPSHFRTLLQYLAIFFDQAPERLTALDFPAPGPATLEPSKAHIEQYYRAIGEGVKQLRRTQGVTLNQLSERVGISSSALKDYESQRRIRRFSLTLAGRFFIATGRNPLELVKETQIGIIRLQHNLRIQALRDFIVSTHEDDPDKFDFVLEKTLDLLSIKPHN